MTDDTSGSGSGTPGHGDTPPAVNPIVDTDQLPVIDDQPTPPTEPTDAGRRRRTYDWKYVKGTRIRTSTALLLIAFIGSWVLFGFASQRYTPEERTVTPLISRPVETTYPEPSTTRPSPSLSTTESSSPSESSTQREQPDSAAESGLPLSSSATTSAPSGADLLPSLLQLPGGATDSAPTTSVPTR